MKTRFIYGPLVLACVIGLFVVDGLWLTSSRLCISALVTLTGALAWLEFSRIVGRGWADRGSRSFLVLGLVGTLAFHVLAWCDGQGLLAPRGLGYEQVAVACVFGVVFASFSLVVFRRDFLVHYRSVLETVLGVLLFGLLFSYCIRIYLIGSAGYGLAIVYFLGIKGTDITAYLVGYTTGRTRFLSVSPKKTLEGCAGALVWGAAWFGCTPWLLGFFEVSEAPFRWWQGILFGSILAILAQVGDLSESTIKRRYEVKDSGGLVPELGGVLDMIDSLLLTGYLFWCLV